MTNKSLAFNEDPVVQQMDFVSQALCSWVWEHKSLLTNLFEMEFSQQSTSNTNSQPEN